MCFCREAFISGRVVQVSRYWMWPTRFPITHDFSLVWVFRICRSKQSYQGGEDFQTGKDLSHIMRIWYRMSKSFIKWNDHAAFSVSAIWKTTPHHHTSPGRHKLLFKHIHSTSLWCYPNLNKLFHWSIGTRKKSYFMEQRFMLKQMNKQTKNV